MSATLNPEELNALMSAIQDGRVAAEPSQERAARVVPYDLTSQDRVIRGQMPTLDAINDQIASMFGVGLSGRTRLGIRVAGAPATLLKFADFMPMLVPPVTVCVLNLGANAQALVALEPGLADALLGAALGDRKRRPQDAPSEARRELTVVERQVLRRILTLFTDAMGSAWAPILPLRPEVARFESDPRLAVVAPANEAGILCPFEVSGALSGRFDLVLPYSVVEPAKKLLSSPPRMGPTGDRRFSHAFERELEQVAVEVRALLGRAQLPLSALLSLEVGAVVPLDTNEEGLVPILVEERLKLLGRPEVANGAMAVKVMQDVAQVAAQDGAQCSAA